MISPSFGLTIEKIFELPPPRRKNGQRVIYLRVFGTSGSGTVVTEWPVWDPLRRCVDQKDHDGHWPQGASSANVAEICFRDFQSPVGHNITHNLTSKAETRPGSNSMEPLNICHVKRGMKKSDLETSTASKIIKGAEILTCTRVMLTSISSETCHVIHQPLQSRNLARCETKVRCRNHPSHAYLQSANKKFRKSQTLLSHRDWSKTSKFFSISTAIQSCLQHERGSCVCNSPNDWTSSMLQNESNPSILCWIKELYPSSSWCYLASNFLEFILNSLISHGFFSRGFRVCSMICSPAFWWRNFRLRCCQNEFECKANVFDWHCGLAAIKLKNPQILSTSSGEVQIACSIWSLSNI